MLHGNETWPVRKENDVALQWTEIRMVRWICDVKVKNRVRNRAEREIGDRFQNLNTIPSLFSEIG